MKSLTRPAAFIAPGGKAVYFADYVYVGNRVVQMRSNLGAAQIAVQSLLAGNLVLTQANAEPAVTHGTVFLCMP
jgi:pyruvate/2-oxoacid:ferredoxin oxidoreductase alpha subunit